LRDTQATAGEVDWNEAHAQRFAAAMDNDFNSALAISVLFELASEVNRSKSSALARQLKGLGGVLGLLQRDPQEFFQGDADASIQELIAQRTAAKKAKNFTEADRIRKELLDQGIVLEDSASGTTWRRQ
jgi:cysteinyl-tRNA synthetase